jgi:hypothetical protein
MSVECIAERPEFGVEEHSVIQGLKSPSIRNAVQRRVHMPLQLG